MEKTSEKTTTNRCLLHFKNNKNQIDFNIPKASIKSSIGLILL